MASDHTLRVNLRTRWQQMNRRSRSHNNVNGGAYHIAQFFVHSPNFVLFRALNHAYFCQHAMRWPIT